ncbi:exonuclease domain-containing protein [Domibacillus enclensis]|uniref:DNA polymerase III subunit epsilon n=1 Tax=Domibacillus enclensis TaxID=1017273 RepID=A0A1N7BNY2_9BACI|nr:exonuclease domain-containing protein [Domibacillus enclensis]OXS74492.1 DNA polymerase III subunit epsilon [Domibacillus enclensis]SIR53035.1 DNA polymerase-3 subunit epsilon [Domibacillus enclensis]
MGFNDFMKNLSGNRFTGLQGGRHDMAFMRSLQRDLKTKQTTSIPLNELQVIVFDLETTGFHPDKGDQILSIGAVKVTGRHVEDEYYSPVRFTDEIPPLVKDLTGLDESELMSAPEPADVLEQFFKFSGASPLVAHHASHEKAFMTHASRKYFRTPFSHRLIDTSFMYRIAEPDNPHVRLEDCCEHNQIAVTGRHHALGDARLTAALWAVYVEKLQKMGITTLSQVYERLATIR